MRVCPACFFAFALAAADLAFAQHQEANQFAPIDPAKAESEAHAIVAEMLAQVPTVNSSNTGRILITDRNKLEHTIPAFFEIIGTPTNWLSIYEARDPNHGTAATKLTVTHTEGAPNRYKIVEPVAGGTNVTVRELTPEQAMTPFAGSDFWVADLGLEFLHWPKHRLIQRDTRHEKACYIMESINPNPVPGGYARVRSWIIINGPRGIVHADAYDSNNKKLKEFDPVSVEKVEGQYQLQEMEMRNAQTRSHTSITFNLKPE
jgi:hypothetical protein